MKMANESKSVLYGADAPARRATLGAGRKILLVACTEEDARSIRETLLRIKVQNPIEILPHTSDLLPYLKREGNSLGEATSPALILLDLSNREESGFGLLRRLHNRVGDLKIPIAVLAGKEGLDQIRRAYQLGVRTFLRKPLSPTEFKAMIETLQVPIVYALKTEPALV